MNRLSSSFLLATVLVAAACGGSSESDERNVSAKAPITIDDLPGTVARELCAGVATCCAGTSFQEGACREQWLDEFEESFIESVHAGRIEYDGVLAAECVSKMAAQAAACDSIEDISPECDAVFRGTLPPGSACTDTAECAPPEGGWADCDALGDGKCAVFERAGEGEPCLWTCRDGSSECWSDDAADDSPTLGYCERNDGLFCGDGVCQRVGEVGARCASDDGCGETAYCGEDLRCAPLPADGEECSPFGFCARGLFCDLAPDGSNAVCRPRLDVGEACDESRDVCAGDAYCDQGVCVVDSETISCE